MFPQTTVLFQLTPHVGFFKTVYTVSVNLHLNDANDISNSYTHSRLKKPI